MRSWLYRLQRMVIVLCHIGVIAFSLVVAFWLRFDFSLPAEETQLLNQALWLAIPVKTIIFLYARFHRGWWRMAGMADLLRLLLGNTVASAVFSLLTVLAIGPSFPRSIYIIDFLVCFLLSGGMRFVARLFKEAWLSAMSRKNRKGCLIYGARSTGRVLLREICSNPSLGYQVVGFLDDDPKMRHADFMGVPVLGRGRDVVHVVDRLKNRSPKIEEVIVALPSAGGKQIREAVANCRAAGLTCKTIPGIKDLLNGKGLTAQIQKVSPGDLLERDQVELEEKQVRNSLSNRTVLVTGAAGSIGSELCRQVARFQPRRLVALDQAESDLFRIDRELRRNTPGLELVPEIGDIRDARRVDDVLRRHGVNAVFHAAAYKHVPLMEDQVLEAVKNNVLGTWNLVKAAEHYHASKFLMISTDKAVNPSSIMGLTKRAAELVVASMKEGDPATATQYVSVRFGNVLGSNGSVVPIFQEQIASGGPLTVTHPEVKRYFMTVPEAVQLVLQASTIGKGSEIFVLDMGKPVRVLDLALNMIRLAGLTPYEDIEIRFTGLRPGEKLHEELTIEGENMLPTHHKKIRIFRGACPSRKHIEPWLVQLESLVASRNESAVLFHLQSLVPEYRPFGEMPGRRILAGFQAATAG